MSPHENKEKLSSTHQVVRRQSLNQTQKDNTFDYHSAGSKGYF